MSVFDNATVLDEWLGFFEVHFNVENGDEIVFVDELGS